MLSNKLTMAVAGAAAGEPYWISTWGGVTSDYANDIAVDSSGNIYVVGNTLSPSNGVDSYDCLIAKYNTSGTIQWQRVLGKTGSDYGTGIALDSSGNVYISGLTNSTGIGGAGGVQALIAKYNSSGTLQWQRVLGAGVNDQAAGIAVDSSGNVYITGFSPVASVNDLLLAKYNTSGTLQWQRTLGSTDDPEQGRQVAVDSSGNVYVCGDQYIAGNYKALIAKYDTSGTIQWQRSLGGVGGASYGFGIAVDSSGNVFMAGATAKDSFGSEDLLLAKYNTSGTLQWQRRLGSAAQEGGRGITLDSSGNVYVIGNAVGGAGGFDCLIAKYNTSGTVQWQRLLGGSADENTNGQPKASGIALDADGNIYICGDTKSSGAVEVDALIAKLPPEGTGTGTYGIWTYQVSTLSTATATLTSIDPALTSATSSLTSATSTMTDKPLIQTFTMA